MTTEPLLPNFPPNTNAFHNDAYHMGTVIGTNCTILYEQHSNKEQDYIIVVNTKTGEKLKINLK